MMESGKGMRSLAPGQKSISGKRSSFNRVKRWKFRFRRESKIYTFLFFPSFC